MAHYWQMAHWQQMARCWRMALYWQMARYWRTARCWQTVCEPFLAIARLLCSHARCTREAACSLAHRSCSPTKREKGKEQEMTMESYIPISLSEPSGATSLPFAPHPVVCELTEADRSDI